MRAAPSIVGRTVVNLIACGLAVSGIVSLAGARVCPRACVAANGLSMTVVLTVGVCARFDGLARLTVASVVVFASARPGAGASLCAVSIGVAAPVAAAEALLDLGAGNTVTLIPARLTSACGFVTFALLAFGACCESAAASVVKLAVVNLVALDLTITHEVGLAGTRVGSRTRLCAVSVGVAAAFANRTLIDLSALEATARVAHPACAGPCVRAGLVALGIGVAPAINQLTGFTKIDGSALYTIALKTGFTFARSCSKAGLCAVSVGMACAIVDITKINL